MARFAFEARDARGAAQSGHRDAPDAGAVARELAAAGLVPVAIRPDDEPAPAARRSLSLSFGRKVTLDELILFSHQMYSLTHAGIPLVRAVRGLSESSRSEVLRETLTDVADSLETGTDLATSLQRHGDLFSSLYASVIHVGENTGRLDDAFAQAARYLELERETARRLKAATRYPIFVIAAISVAMVILNIFVIPAFAGAFEKFDAELPWQTQAILAVSGFFERYWWVLAATAVSVWFAARRFVATPAGRLQWDRWKLRLPLVGSVLNRIALTRYCHTFAMAFRAGVPITQGLGIVARALGNAWLAARVDEMRTAIARGTGITQAARDSRMFTPVVLQMIAVGEETGSIDDLLEQAAGFYEEEVDYELKRLTDAIEPILIVAIGGMVLVLALGVFLPLWDLSGVANK